MNNSLKAELLRMKRLDASARDKLLQDGKLNDGYNQEMEKIHAENTERLTEIINMHGWPGRSLVGEEGAEAAWIIMQHGIGNPKAFKAMVPFLKKATENGESEKIWLAKTLDRICFYEGRPQIYGTNYDWDENGELSPTPIEASNDLNTIRKSMGLSPISEHTKQMRASALKNGERPPKNYKKYKAQADEWAKKVGWRND